MTSPTLAWAKDVAAPVPDGAIPFVPFATPPANSRAPVPTTMRKIAQGTATVGGCGLAALAVCGCLLLVGYCTGKLTTKAIDKALSF